MAVTRRLFVSASLAVLCVGAFAQHRPAPNAFLDHSVKDVHGLVNEVRSDSAVMDRFKRHFAMSGEDVIEFLSQLHVAQLPKAEMFTIYSAPAGGYIKAHKEKLPAGTLVFADDTGRPILEVKCGNPLTSGPSKPTEIAPPPPPPHRRPPPPPHEEAPQGHPHQAPPIFVPTPPTTIIVEAPPAQVAPAQPIPPAVSTSTVENRTTTTRSYSSALALIPIVLIFDNHGGHGHNDHHKQPVPEPTSLVAAAMGVGLIVRRRKAKNKV